MESKSMFMLLLLMLCVAADDVTLETGLGRITGEAVNAVFVDGTSVPVTQFRGIPYAEPPTGSRRFQRSIPKEYFPENLIAKFMPPMCLQNSGIMRVFGTDPDSLNQSEDCLYLNVYIPGNRAVDQVSKYAVMIWIYPGKWEYGFMDTYEGQAFAGLNDVILVLFNHRNSLLGFLSTGENDLPGNYGLSDQHLAIKWVHDHIEDFGGDPTRITVFGESSGASSAIYQALYEPNAGLFQRIIAESCSVNSPISYDKNPMSAFVSFANKSGCLNESNMETINCLYGLTFEELKDLLELEDKFGPVVDGEFITFQPDELFLNKTEETWNMIQRLGNFDLIIGFNSAEGGQDIPKTQRWIKKIIPDATNLYTKDIFENIIVPFAIDRAQMIVTSALKVFVIHQYIDWSDEDNSETIYQRTIDLLSDIVINAAIMKTTVAHSNTEGMGSLYLYLFDFKWPASDLPFPGAQHFDEVGYVFGFPPWFVGRYFSKNLTIGQTEIYLSKALMTYWTNFAKAGNPNGGSDTSTLTSWPGYNTDTQEYILFNADVESFPNKSRFESSRMDFWNRLYPTYEVDYVENCEKCKEILSPECDYDGYEVDDDGDEEE